MGSGKNQPKGKLRSATEEIADAAAGEAIGAVIEVAANALSGAGNALSCAADVAVECAGAAAEVACHVAGAALDGV